MEIRTPRKVDPSGETRSAVKPVPDDLRDQFCRVIEADARACREKVGAPAIRAPTQGEAGGGGSGGLAVFAVQFQIVGSAAA
jgi:hypothetical protein